jgi:choline dehydrogenase-like flavoprotein
LLENCDVREIVEDGTKVIGLNVSVDGQTARLVAGRYALCAGSLGSARLLLASQSQGPEGSANSSGWVGRGLMFHLNEMFVLWPGRKSNTEANFERSISLRDFYHWNGQRFGIIQSMGMTASYGNIVHYMGQIYDQSPLRRFRSLREFLRLPALVASHIFGKAAIFVAIIEDFPYFENRVVLNEEDPEVPTFEYSFHPELLRRRKAFRRAIMRAFRGHRRLLATARPNLNFGHPVGTLRFGSDPSTSVLNSDCRSHDLHNLYVGDASFMPSALGVNPSLTIAANALRVADIIAQDLKAEKDATDVYRT